MIKHLGLLMRKTGMTRAAFVKRYENGHVPLVWELMGSTFAAYNRSYPEGIAEDRDTGFDAMTQIWFASAADETRNMTLMNDAEIVRRIAEDEAQLFERAELFFFKADERTTRISPPTKNAVKSVCLSTPMDVPHDTLIEKMENTVVPQIMGLGGVTECVRNYPIPGSTFQHKDYDKNTRRPPSLITEIWFGDRNAFATWQAAYQRAAAAANGGDVRDYLGDIIEVRQCGDVAPVY